jgi:hypothetical protein
MICLKERAMAVAPVTCAQIEKLFKLSADTESHHTQDTTSPKSYDQNVIRKQHCIRLNWGCSGSKR